MSPVKFYDIISIHPKVWWSPNTVRSRFVLNYKQIPYTTIGVHYPDIQETSKKLGLGPQERWPAYTLPIIEHEDTVVRGTVEIAKYLDAHFPEKPVFGEECEKWGTYMRKSILLVVWPMVGPMVPSILDDRDRQFFESTRQLPERTERHEALVEAMKPMTDGIKQTGYVYGGQIHYADFLLASILVWMLRTNEEDFEKVVDLAGIEDWWQDMSQYLESTRPRL
jgi:glutathione S-transferase